jgi:succinate-semialdehyde dehydrogenase/glutarate-semialdehyde dehydrogenase
MNFKDATLFRQAALVGGDWIEVRSDNAIAVDNPATGEVIGSGP